jgi:hypothetical protein
MHRNVRRLPLPPTMIHSHATPPCNIRDERRTNRPPQKGQ